MPAISVDLTDLILLVGKDPGKEVLSDALLRFGAELKDIGPDGKTTIDVLANRPDLFCAEGIARALRPFIDSSSGGLREYATEKSGGILVIDRSVLDVRPFVVAATATDLHFNDDFIKSLMDLQEKLHLTLGRKRAKVSIGVHDSSRIKPPYTYKAADPDTTSFVPLGMDCELSMKEILQKHPKGIDYAWILKDKDKFPIITDSAGQVLSFPPIINGTVTTVTQKTEKIFIDVTGTDATAIRSALVILCTALADRGASIGTVTVKHPDGTLAETPDLSPKRRNVSISYINSLLGTAMSPDDAASSLRLLGHGASANGCSVDIKVPCYRRDIMHDADIAEDAGIGYGFDKILPILPKASTFGGTRILEKFSTRLEDYMVGHGFTQAFTAVLSSEKEQYGLMNTPSHDCSEIQNPLNIENTCLRVSLLPSLLKVLSQNTHHDLPQRIFEVADVVLENKNRRKLAFVAIHSKTGFTECKSLVESLFRYAHAELEVVPKKSGMFIEGRSASAMVGSIEIGHFGEISLEALKNWGLSNPVIAAELDAALLMGQMA